MAAKWDVSPQWAWLVARWNELITVFREEMAAGKSAPKTYALMQELPEEKINSYPNKTHTHQQDIQIASKLSRHH